MANTNSLHQPPAELRKAEAMRPSQRRKPRNRHFDDGNKGHWDKPKPPRPYEHKFDEPSWKG